MSYLETSQWIALSLAAISRTERFAASLPLVFMSRNIGDRGSPNQLEDPHDQ
jgi:hypothetical protein